MITKKIIFLLFIFSILTYSQGYAQITDTAPLNEQQALPVSEGQAYGEAVESEVVLEENLLILDAEDRQTGVADTALNTFSAWDFVRMIIVLAGVLGFIYLLFFLLKKTGKPRIVADSLIRILSTQNLETGRSLHLVEIGPQVFLIGSGDGSVQLISEITEKETIDTIKLHQSERSNDSRTFTDTFISLFNKKGKGKIKPASGHVSFMQKQKERLKNM